MSYEFVDLSLNDRKDVLDIFNHYVETSFAAFPEERAGDEFFERLLTLCQGYPALAVREEGRTVGFILLRAYHPAGTFRKTAEITYFLLPQHTGRDVGSRALELISEQALKMGIENLIATVSSRNEQSLRFHERAGFQCCGRLCSVGRKFGQDFDVVLFQKKLK